MKSILHKMKENRIIVDIMFIFAISVILSIQMFNKNINIYLNEGGQNLAKAYGMYKSILQNGTGNVILHFANGFGYSWNFFYAPLSTYILILFGIIAHSFNFGFKLMILGIFFLSGCMMYKFVYQLTGNRDTALLSGIIYITTPYFFTDIYIRHDISELMFFIFIPMIFLGLYNLFNTEENHYYFIFGAVRLDFVK